MRNFKAGDLVEVFFGKDSSGNIELEPGVVIERADRDLFDVLVGTDLHRLTRSMMSAATSK